MSQQTEKAAALISPEQAGEVLRILDSQAKWENMRSEPGSKLPEYSLADLRGRQQAFDTFRVQLSTYTSRYKTAAIPELARVSADRLADWCRTVRAILRQTEHLKAVESPVHLLAKVHRLADRIAARTKTEPFLRGGAIDSVASAIRELDTAIEWCDSAAARAKVQIP